MGGGGTGGGWGVGGGGQEDLEKCCQIRVIFEC